MAEEGPRKVINVLLLGRTGRGKSTTGNKLINADGNNSAEQAKEGKLQREWPSKPSAPNGQPETPSQPIKFVAEERIKSVTEECEIIANTVTGFRVMDTRGFAHSQMKRTVYLENLQIIREVVGVSTKEKLAFHRVLYFLPERDIPERADGYLQEELQVLWHFYGDNILKNMVVVVTAPPRSQSVETDIDTRFEKGSVAVVKNTFEEALRNAIHCREDANPPSCPDVIFIPAQASHETVAEIVKNAKVCALDGIFLQFRKTTCTKCASVIHIRQKKDGACIAGAEVEEGRISIPEETECHPALIPKYTKLEKFRGGIAHLATLGIPEGIYRLATKKKTIWPWFTNSEELCDKCKCPTGEKGCTRVGETYKEAKVEHDHKILAVQID